MLIVLHWSCPQEALVPMPKTPPKAPSVAQQVVSTEETVVWYNNKKDIQGLRMTTVPCIILQHSGKPSIDISRLSHLHPLSQEVHLPDGTVKVDGKRLQLSQLEAYRAGSSTRLRSRSRGGVVVRSREPCPHVQAHKHIYRR